MFKLKEVSLYTSFVCTDYVAKIKDVEHFFNTIKRFSFAISIFIAVSFHFLTLSFPRPHQ